MSLKKISIKSALSNWKEKAVMIEPARSSDLRIANQLDGAFIN